MKLVARAKKEGRRSVRTRTCASSLSCKKMEELAADLLCYSLGRSESSDVMKPPVNT